MNSKKSACRVGVPPTKPFFLNRAVPSFKAPKTLLPGNYEE